MRLIWSVVPFTTDTTVVSLAIAPSPAVCVRIIPGSIPAVDETTIFVLPVLRVVVNAETIPGRSPVLVLATGVVKTSLTTCPVPLFRKSKFPESITVGSLLIPNWIPDPPLVCSTPSSSKYTKSELLIVKVSVPLWPVPISPISNSVIDPLSIVIFTTNPVPDPLLVVGIELKTSLVYPLPALFKTKTGSIVPNVAITPVPDPLDTRGISEYCPDPYPDPTEVNTPPNASTSRFIEPLEPEHQLCLYQYN